MILGDEGLNGNIIRELRELDVGVEWIMEINPGITDEEVIKYAKAKRKILITEDKDFGEWIFAHKVTGLTIVFLRYEKRDYNDVVKFLKKLIVEILEDNLDSTYQFITINKNKVRRRKI